MGELEFYIFEDELWCKSTDGTNALVDESSTEIVSLILNKVRACFPKAFEALQRCYEKSSLNPRYYQYLMAKRFCKCNFAPLDPTAFDVEKLAKGGVFNFEKVSCPLRGECMFEGVICEPEFDNKLSSAEKRVMKMYYFGKDKNEIAEVLFLSPNTIKNHIKSAYMKLGVHNKAEFINYAKDNNLFN